MDGPTAVAQAAREAYDAIVIDVRMPGLSGPDLFEMLRAQGSPLADRALFVCADINPEVLTTLDRLNRPVLAKPFRVEEFAAALRGLGIVDNPPA